MQTNLWFQIIVLYLCGSIPFGLIASYLFKTADPRTIGSGNIGATNMLRTGNKASAIFTLVGDALKAWLPLYLLHDALYSDLFYLFPVLGHMFPIWLNFKGGKGVASALGALMAYDPMVAILSMVVFIVIAVLSRYASLASIGASIFAPSFVCYQTNFFHGRWLILLAILIIIAHRENVTRLIQGTEKRFGQKKE